MTCDEELAEAARSTFANRPSGNDGATTKTKNGDMHSIVTSKDVDGVAEEQTAAVENVDDEAAPKQ